MSNDLFLDFSLFSDHSCNILTKMQMMKVLYEGRLRVMAPFGNGHEASPVSLMTVCGLRFNLERKRLAVRVSLMTFT